MIPTKSNKLKVTASGAINGILFGTLIQTILSSISLYERYFHEQYLPHIHISLHGYYFNWWFFLLLSSICTTIASFIVHQYFAQYMKSSFWFWQTVGVVAVLVGTFCSMLFISYQVYSNFDVVELDSILRALEGDLSTLLLASPIVATFNLFFALILKWRKLDLP